MLVIWTEVVINIEFHFVASRWPGVEKAESEIRTEEVADRDKEKDSYTEWVGASEKSHGHSERTEMKCKVEKLENKTRGGTFSKGGYWGKLVVCVYPSLITD